MTAHVNAEHLAKVYVKIREKRRELAKKDDELKAQLDIVSAALLDICKEQGAATIRTDAGTIMRKTTKQYWTRDWESFYKFIADNNAFSLLQQRINNANMAAFIEHHPDLLPPGLNAEATQTISILKR